MRAYIYCTICRFIHIIFGKYFQKRFEIRIMSSKYRPTKWWKGRETERDKKSLLAKFRINVGLVSAVMTDWRFFPFVYTVHHSVIIIDQLILN